MRGFNPARIQEKYGDLARRLSSKGLEHDVPDGGFDNLVVRRPASMGGAGWVKVMIRERGTFLFLRQPRHVYQISPGSDVGDVCVEALARLNADGSVPGTFAESFPGIVPEPRWAADETDEARVSYAGLGWYETSMGEARRAFAAFERLGSASQGSGLDPGPSVVWDISAAYSESEQTDTEPDLTRKLLDALRERTPHGRRWLVFDDICANVVWFDPWRIDDELYRSSWLYPILPRGDHPQYRQRTHHGAFVSLDFQEGFLTYLREDSLCVFGQGLIAAVEARRPTLLRTRRRETPADPARRRAGTR